MKRTYIIPETQTTTFTNTTSLLVGTPGVTGGGAGSGTGYGGIDDGTHDPDAKYREDDLTEEELQMLLESEAENVGHLW